MKNLLAAALLVLVCSFAFSQAPAPQPRGGMWEYQLVAISVVDGAPPEVQAQAMTEQVNAFAKDGWELLRIERNTYFVFKRGLPGL
jgi:hypothetical protein